MAQRRAQAPKDGEIQAGVTRKIPRIVVEVLPGNTAINEGRHYEEGKRFKTEGPTAIALVQAGHVKIVGSE